MFMSKQNKQNDVAWRICICVLYNNSTNFFIYIHIQVHVYIYNTKRINHSNNPADYILYYHPIVLSMTTKQLNSFLIHGHRAGKCYKILYVVSELPNTGIAMCTALLLR